MITPDTAPFLETERFELWRPRATDLGDLVALMNSAETRRHLGPGAVASHSAQLDRLLKTAGGWALYGYSTFYVRARGASAIIGAVGVFHSWRGFGKGMDDGPEAGWIVHEDWWRKGVAAETMAAALAWFDAAHGPRRIGCMIEEGNIASFALAERLGFVRYDTQVAPDDGAQLVLLERGAG